MLIHGAADPSSTCIHSRISPSPSLSFSVGFGYSSSAPLLSSPTSFPPPSSGLFLLISLSLSLSLSLSYTFPQPILSSSSLPLTSLRSNPLTSSLPSYFFLIFYPLAVSPRLLFSPAYPAPSHLFLSPLLFLLLLLLLLLLLPSTHQNLSPNCPPNPDDGWYPLR